MKKKCRRRRRIFSSFLRTTLFLRSFFPPQTTRFSSSWWRPRLFKPHTPDRLIMSSDLWCCSRTEICSTFPFEFPAHIYDMLKFKLMNNMIEEWKWLFHFGWFSYLKNRVSMPPLTRWVAGSRHRNLRTSFYSSIPAKSNCPICLLLLFLNQTDGII